MIDLGIFIYLDLAKNRGEYPKIACLKGKQF